MNNINSPNYGSAEPAKTDLTRLDTTVKSEGLESKEKNSMYLRPDFEVLIEHVKTMK